MRPPQMTNENHKHISCSMLALSIENNFKNTALCQRVKASFEHVEPMTVIKDLISGVSKQSWTKAYEEYDQAMQADVSLISIFDKEFPHRLRQIDDPPLILYVRGALPKNKCVSIVGARKATPYGKRVAIELSRSLTEGGYSVVSGLAYGIDQAAHQGALQAASKVSQSPGVAVLGTNLDEISPLGNRRLAQSILDYGGCVLSEYHFSSRCRKDFFPRRNRIISALSDSIIVVEAAKRSGALITARLASEQGREVYFVPGPIDSKHSVGCNHFIAQGGNIIADLESFFEAMELEAEVADSSSDRTLSPEEGLVVEVLQESYEPDFEYILSKTDLTTAVLRGVLSRLEVKGILSLELEGYYRLAGENN